MSDHEGSRPLRYGALARTDALLELHNDACSFDDKTKALAAGIKPSAVRAAVKLETSSNCDEPSVHTTKFDAAGFRTHVRRIEGYGNWYSRPVFLFCDSRCCTGPTGILSDTESTVTAVCFRGSAAEPKLASISTVAG